MRQGELDCIHGVGHSAGIHGCDGCCIILLLEAKAEAWDEAVNAVIPTVRCDSEDITWYNSNPYRKVADAPYPY